MGNKINIDLKQSGKRPVTFLLNLTVDYENSHTDTTCEIYEAFLPKLQKLITKMEVD